MEIVLAQSEDSVKPQSWLCFHLVIFATFRFATQMAGSLTCDCAAKAVVCACICPPNQTCRVPARRQRIQLYMGIWVMYEHAHFTCLLERVKRAVRARTQDESLRMELPRLQGEYGMRWSRLASFGLPSAIERAVLGLAMLLAAC